MPEIRSRPGLGNSISLTLYKAWLENDDVDHFFKSEKRNLNEKRKSEIWKALYSEGGRALGLMGSIGPFWLNSLH